MCASRVRMWCNSAQSFGGFKLLYVFCVGSGLPTHARYSRSMVTMPDENLWYDICGTWRGEEINGTRVYSKEEQCRRQRIFVFVHDACQTCISA